MHILIDGYSLIHAVPELKASLEAGRVSSARQRLIRFLEKSCSDKKNRITVVFDGPAQSGNEGYESPNINVLFTPSQLTADGVIERFVASSGNPAGIEVVTADRQERDVVLAAGAQVCSCMNFLSRLKYNPARRSAREHNRPISGLGTLGDLFPS